MMPLSADQTKKALLKKGFVLDDRHHHYYSYYYGGKMVARTRLSHSDQEINDYLISKMKSQCQLTKNQFLDLINCPLDEKGYIKILIETGIIKVEPNVEQSKSKGRNNK